FIHCYEAAASNDKGRGILHHNKNELLTSGGSLNGVHCANPGAYHVDKMRIDDAVNIPVAVIKIDVEGHELRVLQGAEKTIMKNKDRKSTRLNSSHVKISYAVFCLKKKKMNRNRLKNY